jgi:signal transduction histidine kinase
MKPSRVWTLFALCLLVVASAMGWASALVLRLTRAEAAAEAQAVLEENARLALWRMDSTLTSFLAVENARPYFHYTSFYSIDDPLASLAADPAPGSRIAASPLLLDTPALVVLHFQLAPSGRLSSPQRPAGPLADLALARAQTTAERLAERRRQLDELGKGGRARAIASGLAAGVGHRSQLAPPPRPQATPTARALEAQYAQQKMKNVREFEMRQESLSRNSVYIADQVANQAPPARTSLLAKAASVEEGLLSPLWIEDRLVLARRIRVDDVSYIQGCWIDWEKLQAQLLSDVADLVPGARLAPAPVPVPGAPAGTDDDRRLAALPLRLIPAALAPRAETRLSPTHLSLLGAWGFLLLAALAVGALLYGVLALSERRRVFVSAVTHELRTPLTTFRLYTDMMADGMVTDETRRRDYLLRLQQEAQRLGHLVENVLFYSRLESDRARGTKESVELGGLLRDTAERLKERVASGGLELHVSGDAAPTHARLDRAALEQILVNLVDNACKYAAASNPPVVHLELRREGSRALVRVRDHGPGLTRDDRKRLFRAFSKSDREAAHTRPGVGLGLALSRRLARAQGGDLRVDEGESGGACFVVSLPLLS